MTPELSVPQQPDAERSALQWRPDLDPDALPPTPQLTEGQRRVLVACMAQFAQKGFVASSTRDIAAALGVRSPSLYNHFASKEAMLSTLVLLGFEYYNNRILSALLEAGGSPQEQLVRLIREHVLISCEFVRLVTVISHELPHLPEDALAVALGHRNQAVFLLEQILARGHEQGAFDVRHRRTTVTALGSMGLSAATTFPYRPDISMSELADEFVELALRLVAATGPLGGCDAAG